MKCLCQVAKDVVASHGKLVNLFERIQFFLQRLSIYIGIPLTAAMTDLLGKIMGQVLSILALSTKEMTQRRISEWHWLDVSLLANHGIERFLNRFVGRTEVEDALDRLDMLTKEETGMMTVRNLAVTHVVDGHVKVVEEVTRTIDDNVKVVGQVTRVIDDNVKAVEKVTRGIDDNVKAVEHVTRGIDGNVKVVEQVTHTIDENVRTIKDGSQSPLTVTSSIPAKFPLLLNTDIDQQRCQ
jgi:hypothetical protein